MTTGQQVAQLPDYLMLHFRSFLSIFDCVRGINKLSNRPVTWEATLRNICVNKYGLD
jgi:hypothetical protein